MLKKDLLLMAGTAAISSLLTYLAVEKDIFENPSSQQQRPVINTPAGKAGIADDVIRVENGMPVVTRAMPKPDSPQPGTGSRAEPEAAEKAQLAFQKQNELKDKFIDFFSRQQGGDPAALNAEIESRFYQEEWDREWANNTEGSIFSLFEDEKLRDIAPLQVSCRSKNCQVVLAAPDQKQVRLLSEKFMETANNRDIGMRDKVVSFFPEPSTGRLVFYLSENGNMDLFR